MSKIHADTGGPAYPVIVQWSDAQQRSVGLQTGPTSGWHEGMTLLDWHAGQALKGLLASSGGWVDQPYADACREAYKYAEAMIREKRRREEAGVREVANG